MSTILKQGVQVDIELSLPVQKLWDALLNMESLAPKIALNSHKLLKGTGGVGSISLLEFADGNYTHPLCCFMESVWCVNALVSLALPKFSSKKSLSCFDFLPIG